MIFHGNGKLLLSGEYVVLSGAKALAVPTQLGQSLEISDGEIPGVLSWASFLKDGTSWFAGQFAINDWTIIESTDAEIAERLQGLFQNVQSINPAFAEKANQKKAITRLEFPRAWGFGSSSTLLYILATWAEVNPFDLLEKSFGGSGYDLIAAGQDNPFLFWRNPAPQFTPISIKWPFLEELYLVYLGKKQNSRSGIKRYRKREENLGQLPGRISKLTDQILECVSLPDFENLLRKHESLLSELLDLPKVQSLHFSDFPGVVKSLGAWGGDFVLVTSGGLSAEEVQAYFIQRNFEVVYPFKRLLRL